MRVLVAEDDAVSRTILRRAVERFGHECLAAEDSLELCRKHRLVRYRSRSWEERLSFDEEVVSR